jgi:hypothetical protein
MRTRSDCGPVAIANLLEAEGVSSAEDAYTTIMRDEGFPATGGLLDDFWDSPWRHFLLVSKMSGRRVGIMPDPLLTPCVVLIRLSLRRWHWIFVRGYQHGAVVWHDGYTVQTMKFQKRFPGCQFILAYALDEKKALSCVWYFWFLLSKIILAFSPRR